VVEGVR
jgi:hypothetical protein